MQNGKVISIHITEIFGESTKVVDQVEAVRAVGLKGDRYNKSNIPGNTWDPGREVTLIEIEALEAIAREDNIQLAPGESRRNLVTRGVPLNHLVGEQFRVGEVILKGVRLCEPCSHLADLTQPRVLPGLIHRGGLRAQIVQGGMIHVGDQIIID
jgi:MOSC domain-containing protein YiiM